jgi:hypothetical protein
VSIDLDLVMREQLMERRGRVEKAISSAGPNPQLTALLREVDAALERFESGTYGYARSVTIRSRQPGSLQIRWSASASTT